MTRAARREIMDITLKICYCAILLGIAAMLFADAHVMLSPS